MSRYKPIHNVFLNDKRHPKAFNAVKRLARLRNDGVTDTVEDLVLQGATAKLAEMDEVVKNKLSQAADAERPVTP